MINDRYIIECTCINKDNDFGMKVGDIAYYNKKAQTYKYLTKKWIKREWHFDTESHIMVVDEEGKQNPYLESYWSYSIPVTPKMDNAKIYKRIAETENVIKSIEKIGDFSCRILVLKTIIKEYKNDKNEI